MEEIEYTYEVEEVSEETMLVRYKSEGFEDVLVSTHRPLEDEDFNTVIESYAPIWTWVNSVKQKKGVAMGAKGTIRKRLFPEPLPPQPVVVTKKQLVKFLRSRNYQGQNAWEFAKNYFANTATQEDREDWELTTHIKEDEPLLIKLFTAAGFPNPEEAAREAVVRAKMEGN